MDNPPVPRTDAGSAGERMLQARYGTRQRAQRFYDVQVLDHLNPAMRAFVARQEMFFLATSDLRGECDNSFRAGPPGFVRTLDAHSLTWPEYRGNGVLASLGNIAENPHVGLLFVDFFDDGVGLHVNGTAATVDDAAMRAEYPGLPVDPVPGRRSPLWVMIDVGEAYIHCGKFIPRLSKVPGGDAPRQKKSAFFVDPPVPVPTQRPEPVRSTPHVSAPVPDTEQTDNAGDAPVAAARRSRLRWPLRRRR
jgi:uncharacterized protein